MTNLTVKLGSGETATLTEKLLPNESTTLTVWHHVKDRVTDPSYTITAAGGINENGTVYLDYPDIGISQMEVIAESAGKRTVRMTLYNSSAATLAGKKDREVKLAFYADDLHTKPAVAACATNGVSVRDNEITISEDSALARIDQGTFTLDLTYDLGKYMNSIGKTEIPNVGTYLYAEAWAEGQIGGTGSNQRLPEYDGSDSEATVHMTGALARTGERMTIDVTQGNDGNGHSTAAITLRNNSLQSQTGTVLVATLLDAAGTVLETKKTRIGGAISGETFQTETVTFSRLGTRVVVRAAVPGNDLLTFEGLAVGLGDFTANGTNYTYTLQNDSGATSTLVTAVSGNGEPVSINGQALSTGGSATVAIPNSGKTDIVVGIGAKTYTLTILRNSGTGANPFTDVSEKDWFYGDVMFAYENGLMIGTGNAQFRPHGTATRGMMATILWRMAGSPAPKGNNSFTDVEAGTWYTDAITWTAENGIFLGYGNNKVGPNDSITREQLAAIFFRYADYKGCDMNAKGELDKFRDAGKVSDYARAAMQWAVGSGLIQGKPDGVLDPQGTATRAEIAAMLHRFLEKYELVQGKAPGV